MAVTSEGVAIVSEAPAHDAAPSDASPAAITFDAWVAARGPSLVRFAHLVTGNAADAQDTVQDALVGAYPKWGQLQARGTAEAYVRKAIVNRHISIWRSWRRREQPVDDVATLSSAASTEPHEALADADVAWRLCAELPRVQRAAVVLRYYDDQSYAQIAELLGCAESTARSHVRRALTVLRTRLEGEADHA